MKTQDELIKAEIARLEKNGKKDERSLIKQVERAYRKVQYNRLQATMDFVLELGCKELYVEAGAGAGKSTGIARRIQRIVMELPRSSSMLVGETYQQILTRTLPTTIHGLEMLGIYQNLHYFVGRKPPRTWNWPMPYKPPQRADKAIFFWTGACLNLVSHDVSGDGKSLNSDALIADEATQLTKAQLDTDQKPRVRFSNKEKFENSKLALTELYVSTSPVTEEGMWYAEMEEAVQQHRLETEYLLKQGKSKDADGLPLNPNELMFLKANWSVNKKNLPDNYIQKARKSSLDEMLFLAEYWCIRPERVKGGFYAMLDPTRHYYNDFDYSYYIKPGQLADCRGDKDLVKGQPLILGVDWGAVINCLTVNQHLKSINEYRTLKSMYALGDEQKIQDDLFDDFHAYYRHHQGSCDEIYMFYDNSGNNETGVIKKTRAEKAASQLRRKGWKVSLLTKGGRNPLHELTYFTWSYLLKGGVPGMPTYRINKSNCKELVISMRNCKVKQGTGNAIKKDKGSERSKVIRREHATDLSDANDQPIKVLFGRLASGRSGMIRSSIRSQ